VLLMSIPRDLWVNIPGSVPDVSGPNRINAAFNNGPSLLAQTIEQDLGVTINDVAEINFPGFQGMVSSLGGIYLDFPFPVKDAYSGLNITKTGCQLVEGAQALALVRSRHLFYYENGTWNADVQSDFSRIQRQDVFFRALIARMHQKDLDPLSLNAFVGSVTADVTVDSGFKGKLLGLAEEFRSVSGSGLKTETLPTTEFTNSYGEDVLQAAQPYAGSMIKSFLAFGSNTGSKSKSSTTTTTSTTIPASSIHVEVLNGDGGAGAAGTAASQLTSGGYSVSGTNDAASYSFVQSEIQYAPGHEDAARQLAASISGGTVLVVAPSLTADNLILTVGSTFKGLASSSTSSTSSSSTSGTATPPANVVTNTHQEPWNPTVCS
jgi:LCP family protein required for cell wall assembly